MLFKFCDEASTLLGSSIKLLIFCKRIATYSIAGDNDVKDDAFSVDMNVLF